MSDNPDDDDFEEVELDDLDDFISVDEDDLRTTYPDDHQCPFCKRALGDDDETVRECRHCVCRWCADCDRALDIGAVCKLCGMIEFESNDCGLRAPLLPEWRGEWGNDQ